MALLLRRIVAGLQGLFALGCAGIVVKLAGSGSSSPLMWGLVAAFALLALLGVWAMLAMWQGTPAGAVLTLILQLVHLVYLETTWLTLAISLPVALVLGLDSGFHFHTWVAWKPAVEITVEPLNDPSWAGLNLLALLSFGVSIEVLKQAVRKAGGPAAD